MLGGIPLQVSLRPKTGPKAARSSAIPRAGFVWRDRLSRRIKIFLERLLALFSTIFYYHKKVIIDVLDFQEYQSEIGKFPVSEWYEALSPKNQASADRFMGIARKLDQLRPPGFKKFEKLWEARWGGENRVPHRIFCYVPSDRCVTFLCGCTHKDRRYKPTNAYDTAVRRRKEIQEERASTRELNF